MRLVAARTIVKLERHLESQASQKANLNKLDREKEREKKRDRNFIHLYDIIEPSLSLSLSRSKTNDERREKYPKDTKWREVPQTMGQRRRGGGEKNAGMKGREREREAHVCVSYESTQYVNSRWWPHQETCSPLESRVFVSRAPCIIIRARVI